MQGSGCVDGRGVLGYDGKDFLKNAWQKVGYDWFKGVIKEEDMDNDSNTNNSNKAHDDGNEDNNDEDKEVFSNDNEDKEEWEDREEDRA